MSPGKVTFYYAANSRAGATMLLLEELGAPYDVKVPNLNKGEQRQPAYLAVNPMGKVPAITMR
jgi:glutathione S-transferase